MKLEQTQVDGLDWREPENESSQIRRIAWVGPEHELAGALDFETGDPFIGALVVEFRSGGIYAYDDATEKLADELRFAESAGRFLTTQIKMSDRLFERLVIE